MGDFEGAQRAFQFVVQSVPLNEVLNNLAAAQSRNDQPDALENFRKVLEGDPNDPVYHFNVGFVLWRRNQFDAAAERFRAVLDRNPNDQESVVMLGRCLKRSGPRAGDPRSEGLERLKHEYRETAYLQLKEMLEPK
jgi:predicted Zn-dependent protease